MADQEPRGDFLMKKIGGKKSRATVPLNKDRDLFFWILFLFVDIWTEPDIFTVDTIGKRSSTFSKKIDKDVKDQ